MNLFDYGGLDHQLALNVSRETYDRLQHYMGLLEKWNPTINLVGKSTLADGWRRHVLDSAQLWLQARDFETWVDIGSGAGFPGLVNAILAHELKPGAGFHLIESDARKCAFLRNVSRETKVPVNIYDCRIEAVTGLSADILSARALASVDRLLISAEKLLKKNGRCLFLKGQNCDAELAEASANWTYSFTRSPSLIDGNGWVLQIEDVTRVIPTRE